MGQLERFGSLLDEGHLVAKYRPGPDLVGVRFGVEIRRRWLAVEPDDGEINVGSKDVVLHRSQVERTCMIIRYNRKIDKIFS